MTATDAKNESEIVVAVNPEDSVNPENSTNPENLLCGLALVSPANTGSPEEINAYH